MTFDAALLRPWRLPPNRVKRFYRGGRLLDEFRGVPDPADSERPEDWLGSSTRAWTPPGEERSDDGLGDAEIDGRRHRIADLLEADPAAIAGAGLVSVAGTTVGVLVKLLDAGVRLPVHVHPSRAFARTRLGSFFGKAEAWLIQGTRHLDTDGPGVWIGFRRDVGREELLDVVETQDTERLLAAMHRRPTRPGDVWLIPPGLPHAIGAGVFMVEIQEPSDFSIVVETRDVPIDPAHAHLGVGWDVAIDAVDRASRDEAWIDALRHDDGREIVEGPGWRRWPGSLTEAAIDRVFDAAVDRFFRAERLTVAGKARPGFGPPTYLVGVVTGGAGRIRAGSGDLSVRRGDTFAVPAAALADLEIEADRTLELIACLPPDPARLATEEP